MKKLRVGIIGLGNMGMNHVRVYSDMEEVELVAGADSDTKILEKVKEKHSINCYQDYNEMLNSEELDLVSVAVPTSLHYNVALDVIAKKVPLLIEKPISTTLEEADEIIGYAKEKRVKLMIGHIERFNPAVLELKERLGRGELGKIYKVDVNRVGPIPPQIQDVGVVIDLAVHDIDVMRFLTESEPSRIYAETEQRVHSQKEDLLAGIIRFKNRTICYLNVNWLTPTTIRKLYITGEKGMFVIDYLDQKLYFYENQAHNENDLLSSNVIREGRMIRFKINKREPLRNELEHFVDCVRNDKEPLVTGEDGRNVLFIAIKLIESARNGGVVKCES